MKCGMKLTIEMINIDADVEADVEEKTIKYTRRYELQSCLTNSIKH